VLGKKPLTAALSDPERGTMPFLEVKVSRGVEGPRGAADATFITAPALALRAPAPH
jgi:hypothetical protein